MYQLYLALNQLRYWEGIANYNLVVLSERALEAGYLEVIEMSENSGDNSVQSFGQRLDEKGTLTSLSTFHAGLPDFSWHYIPKTKENI
jgi:hypothetical protein